MGDTVSQSERSRIMAAVKSRDTSPELLVRKLAHSLGYRYRLHVRSLPGTPDLVFPRLRKIINVNGCFWHMHSCGRCRIPSSRRDYWIAKMERNAARDRRTTRALRKDGWRVLVIWECQTLSWEEDRLRDKIAAFLEEEVDS
ncbi:MAG: DNA mismatch endonuclease Vsr [Pirellulales bacterium]|nr:DNA mismatch endonuclease Vsr [Pirellulales bacterium]